ncbi:hypothetical protein LSUE1_G007986 [Lachnellula suecica]|uniref:Uncharacterized protein n=1 Tax=Lachnellula suecica TaxID=602035 RepID=A0A8T9BSL3_9HELO|nr:hypothetical protein LSUE1_G007986 [Lachnellula suecica]
MSTTTASYTTTAGGAAYSPTEDSNRKAMNPIITNPQQHSSLPNLPTSEGLRAPAGQLLRGATDDHGNLNKAALMVGIKLDLEAEIHLTARVRGDIVVGLY